MRKKKSGKIQESMENQMGSKKKGTIINLGKREPRMSFFAKGSDICEAIDSKELVLLLMFKGASLSTNDVCYSLFHAIVDVIKEFEDVFPEEVPGGSQLLRDIEHQIDFVPGVVVPNRPSYRSSPKETKELQREVKELLAKGNIQESPSPYAVPILLVPEKDGS